MQKSATQQISHELIGFPLDGVCGVVVETEVEIVFWCQPAHRCLQLACFGLAGLPGLVALCPFTMDASQFPRGGPSSKFNPYKSMIFGFSAIFAYSPS